MGKNRLGLTKKPDGRDDPKKIQKPGGKTANQSLPTKIIALNVDNLNDKGWKKLADSKYWKQDKKF